MICPVDGFFSKQSLRLGTTNNIESPEEWDVFHKCCAWAPKRARSFTYAIHSIKPYGMGFAINWDVTYFTTAKEGEHLIETAKWAYFNKWGWGKPA